MTEDKALLEEPRSKRGFLTVSISVVGVVGVLLAGFILFGGSGEGVATALLILFADTLLIVGFFAKHNWLRNVTWSLILYMLLTSLMALWFKLDIVLWSVLPSYCEDTASSSNIYYDCSTLNEITVQDIISGLSIGSIILALFSAVGSLLSLCWDKIKNVNWAVNIYRAVMGLLGLSAVIYAGSMTVDAAGKSVSDFVYNIATASLVLGGTGAAVILVVSIVFSSKKNKANTRTVEEEKHVCSVDYNSPAAREAFYNFMKEYEYRKSSSFSAGTSRGLKSPDPLDLGQTNEESAVQD